MANIFSYGLLKQYSFEVIEDRISFSDMFRRLENSDSSFLTERTMHEEIALIYSRNIDIDLFDNKNSIFYWIGEAYIRLFFKFHKSIFYIFLYFPLEDMIDAYRVYHEMDWNELYSFFLEKIESKTLLTKLIKKRGLSVNKVSSLTGISANTIQYYCLDDKHLYEAKYAYIDQLALCLKVNTNVFLKEIHNYTNSSEYDFDKTHPLYRCYLGLNFASYYSLDIKKRKYKFNKEAQAFFSGDNKLKVLWTKSNVLSETISCANKEILELIENHSKSTSQTDRERTVLVIFEFNKISQEIEPYKSLLKYGYEKIFIINQQVIICIYNNYWKSYLSSSVIASMIEQAKIETGSDFAIM